MLKIIICDDDLFTLKFTSELLMTAIAASKICGQIVCLASNGPELLNFIKNTPDSYLYFLDFDFGKSELNGIDLVRLIHRTTPTGKFVFVTNHAEKGIDILKSGIQALGFIEKTPEKNIMVLEYIKYLKMASSTINSLDNLSSIELQLGIDESIHINIDEITFVDSVKTLAHSVCYHTFNGSEITVRDTIDHVHEILGENFIRCHRSVLVNKKHVIAIENRTLKLANGSSVNFAIKKKNSILKTCFF